jgi:hypothetical protein
MKQQGLSSRVGNWKTCLHLSSRLGAGPSRHLRSGRENEDWWHLQGWAKFTARRSDSEVLPLTAELTFRDWSEKGLRQVSGIVQFWKDKETELWLAPKQGRQPYVSSSESSARLGELSAVLRAFYPDSAWAVLHLSPAFYTNNNKLTEKLLLVIC